MDEKDINNLADESWETGWEQREGYIANTQEDLVEDLNKEIVKFFLKIKEEFESSHAIGMERKGKNNEYIKLSITNKLLTERSEPEIAITMQPNGKLNVHVNPYDVYDKFYFIAKDITLDQFVEEIDSIKKSLSTGRMHVNTIFEKRDYVNDGNDLAWWLADYTAPSFAAKKAEREENESK